jgi:hypothetical protein
LQHDNDDCPRNDNHDRLYNHNDRQGHDNHDDSPLIIPPRLRLDIPL